MSPSALKRALLRCCTCWDSIRLLDWIDRKGLQHLFFHHLRYRVTPAMLERALAAPPAERARLYALATSYLKVDNTYKTTGLDRTRLADGLLLELAREFDAPRLLEVGVSDGSSALNLLARRDVFAEVVLTDRFSRFLQRRFPLGRAFLDAEGRRFGLKFLCLYVWLSPGRTVDPQGYAPIEVVNPRVREAFGVPAIRRFDLFRDALDRPVQLIKCANILNLAYFDAATIRRALDNLARSLAPGGYVVLSQNNAKYPGDEAALVLRREADGFRPVRNVNGHELAALFPDAPAPETA
ncbi:MAG: hypothetical protein AB7D57_06625 [Desulfovibrionaceae bacterium]